MSMITLSKKIIFPGAFGSNLAATLDLPPYEPVAYALFAHCFTCSKNTLAAFRISRALTEYGIAVLRFDFTGLGGSEGDFANTNFSSNINDLLKAVDFLRENYQEPDMLIGHSLGGAAILAVAPQVSQVKAVVTIAAPADLMHVKKLFANKVDEIKLRGEADVELAGRKFQIKKQFLDDLEQHHLLDTIANLNKALLIFHSPQDKIVNIENAYAIFDAAKQNKSFISLDGADHLLTHEDDAEYVAKILSTWASRYVMMDAKKKTENNSGEVIVCETREGRFTQNILAGKHVLIADEPEAAGGNDLGPSPYEFLLASLGSCTSMTIRMYADLKNIPLDRTIVKLKHDKIYAEDCKNCEDPKAKIDHIDRLIELHGELSEEQRAKLLEIANKCPVHRTLTSKITINTKLAE